MNNLLSVIGVSTLVSIIVSFLFDTIKHKITLRFDKLFNEKIDRYTSILVFMSCVLEPNNVKHIETKNKPDTNTNEDVKEYYLAELKNYRNFCLLFANEGVIIALDNFIKNQSQSNYEIVAKKMRYDLWHAKLK